MVEQMSHQRQPGHAESIEEVLQRGAAMTAPRRAVLESLVVMGGRVTDHPGGRATTILARQLGREGASSSLSALLRGMEADKLIGRDISGKRCFAIYLLDPVTANVSYGPDYEPPVLPSVFQDDAPKTSRAKRALVNLPTVVEQDLSLPTVGQNLTVFLVHMAENGEVQVGLRNGTGSWVTTLQGASW